MSKNQNRFSVFQDAEDRDKQAKAAQAHQSKQAAAKDANKKVVIKEARHNKRGDDNQEEF